MEMLQLTAVAVAGSNIKVKEERPTWANTYKVESLPGVQLQKPGGDG